MSGGHGSVPGGCGSMEGQRQLRFQGIFLEKLPTLSFEG